MAVDEDRVRAATAALEVVVSWHSGNQKRKVQSIVDELKVAVGDQEAAPAEPAGELEQATPVSDAGDPFGSPPTE